MRHFEAILLTVVAIPAAGTAQSAAPVGAEVRIVTTAGRVIRGQVVKEDSATLSVWPSDAHRSWTAVVTARDSVALLEVRSPGRFRPVYLLMGAAAGAAGGSMLGATVAWMECPLGEGFVCSEHGRRDQMRTMKSGMEIGAAFGLLAGFAFRPGRWRSVPAAGARPAVTGLSRGLGLGVNVPF